MLRPSCWRWPPLTWRSWVSPVWVETQRWRMCVKTHCVFCKLAINSMWVEAAVGGIFLPLGLSLSWPNSRVCSEVKIIASHEFQFNERHVNTASSKISIRICLSNITWTEGSVVLFMCKIPVFKGAAKPILGTSIDAGRFHGQDGLGDAPDPDAPGLDLVQKEGAVSAMIRIVNENPGEVRYVTQICVDLTHRFEHFYPPRYLWLPQHPSPIWLWLWGWILLCQTDSDASTSWEATLSVSKIITVWCLHALVKRQNKHILHRNELASGCFYSLSVLLTIDYHCN